MAKPKQVEEQAKHADELQAKVIEEQGADPVQPQGPTTDPQDESPSPEGGDESFDQKHRTLQGMYDKSQRDLAAAEAERSRQGERIVSMEGLIANIQNTQQQQQQQQQQQPQPPKQYTTAEDIENYGDEQIALIRRVALDAIQPISGHIEKLTQAVQQMQQLSPQLQQQVQNVASQQSKVGDTMFMSELAKRVPNWHEINTSEAFKSWLLEIDPMSGNTRQALLDEAHRQLNPSRVAMFFDIFTKSQTSTQQPTAGIRQPVSGLEQQIAPSRGRNPTIPTNADNKRNFTQEEVRRFFDDKLNGRYKGKEDECDKTELAIFEAGAEGRITPS